MLQLAPPGAGRSSWLTAEFRASVPSWAGVGRRSGRTGGLGAGVGSDALSEFLLNYRRGRGVFRPGAGSRACEVSQ